MGVICMRTVSIRSAYACFAMQIRTPKVALNRSCRGSPSEVAEGDGRSAPPHHAHLRAPHTHGQRLRAPQVKTVSLVCRPDGLKAVLVPNRNTLHVRALP